MMNLSGGEGAEEQARSNQYGYHPKTKETKAAYELLLGCIQKQLDEQPLSIDCGVDRVADEILAVLKEVSISDKEKKMEIEVLLNPISDELFYQLVSIVKLITDYQEGDDSGVGKAGEGDDEERDLDKDEEDDEPDKTLLRQFQEIVLSKDDDVDESDRTGDLQVGLANLAIDGKDAGHVKEDTSLRPEKCPPPTELLDLQPLPVTALRNPSYESLYQDFKHFNPVQTQVFDVLYNTSDNVLVAAPTGSGKTICAEFAILKNHHQEPDSTMRVVYIAPLEAIAKERFCDWETKFGKGLGLRVVELTGEIVPDLKLLEKGQIIISTPEKWDALSRRWKQRKFVQQVSLFIVDELHLIGAQGGHVLEVIVSRMRQISSEVENKMRIIALSTSVANAKDLGEWIGASASGLFNFPPNVRPAPLEIHNQGVDIMNFEGFSVESHLQHFLHDNFNTEVAHGIIENTQDAVDYLTWSFMYKRLPRNPNYYNLVGVSHRHLSDHLLELVENTLSDLEASKCIEIDNDLNISPLYLGMIASYYYIRYTTIERFSSLLTSKMKINGLLEVLTSASEYDLIPIRPDEEEKLRRLINHQRFSFENPKCTDPHVKANALLQAHFSRQEISRNLTMDQHDVLLSATRLLHAMVDVIASNGWLNLALLAMEVSQMVTQGLWDRDSVLLQLPHFTKDLAKRCNANNIEDVFDLVEMEDDKRRELLQMEESELVDVARFCNRYPYIDLSYEVVDSNEITPGKEITLQIMLERDLGTGPMHAPRYPKTKEEGWWLVVGEPKTDQVMAIRRVLLQRKAKVKLEFEVPTEPGEKSYMVYFMCDSYIGCDQEYTFSVDVKAAP